MSKEQVVTEAKSRFEQAQNDVLGFVFDSAKAEGIAEAQAAANGGEPLPPPVDTTPYSEEQMQELRNQVTDLQTQLATANDEIAKVKSDDDSDKAAISAAQNALSGLQGKMAAIEAIIHSATGNDQAPATT